MMLALAKKLGIREGARVRVVGAPASFREALEPLPDDVRFLTRLGADTTLVHLFTKKRTELQRELAALRRKLDPEAAVWVSWPKKASGVATDITEDSIRAVALPLGFVDIKVCAVDETWSGLKLVVRKGLR